MIGIYSAPSHYLDHSWRIVNGNLRNEIHWLKKNALGNVICQRPVFYSFLNVLNYSTLNWNFLRTSLYFAWWNYRCYVVSVKNPKNFTIQIFLTEIWKYCSFSMSIVLRNRWISYLEKIMKINNKVNLPFSYLWGTKLQIPIYPANLLTKCKYVVDLECLRVNSCQHN